MKKRLVKGLMIAGAILGTAGCVEGYTPVEEEKLSVTVELPTNVQAAIDGPKSNLDDAQTLKDSIAFMYSEEGLAHDVYMAIYKIQPVMQLQNIATKSEVKHIEAVNQIAQKYDLNMTQYPDTDVPYSTEGISSGVYPVQAIQELYDELYDKGIQSPQAALEVGCKVEVIDIDDLDGYIQLAESANASDILTVFNFLRQGSYKHYWAFNDALIGMNVADGCCQIAKDLGHATCPTYPRN